MVLIHLFLVFPRCAMFFMPERRYDYSSYSCLRVSAYDMMIPVCMLRCTGTVFVLVGYIA